MTKQNKTNATVGVYDMERTVHGVYQVLRIKSSSVNHILRTELISRHHRHLYRTEGLGSVPVCVLGRL